MSEADVVSALDSASGGPVGEGTIGAGTGMVSYGFKGGIGTSSRKLPDEEGGYTIGVLVNANHGAARNCVMAGVPVGLLYEKTGSGSSLSVPERPRTVVVGRRGQRGKIIIIIIATDAPLDGRQARAGWPSGQPWDWHEPVQRRDMAAGVLLHCSAGDAFAIVPRPSLHDVALVECPHKSSS